ncbi:hypothetical protein [Agrobacterium sp. Azo12]|uniref:hypothetical protein n=1 Tax=Agrobacterium sp. Azo12 TaxID=3031129 RepID=UPI0023D86B1D|nr:hypothetical protein [Agrobacterium sp. Azo12]MDO5897893.1 hypothetical protein [Agrobacterium sp. Azo12]
MAKRFEALNRLMDSVRDSNHDFRITTDPFPPLDAEKVEKTLDILRKGTENGVENMPVPSAKSRNEAEQSIVARVEAERDASYQILEDQLHTYSSRMRNLDFDGHFGRIRQANVSSLTDFKADVAGGTDVLFGFRKKLREADEELVHFKDRNGLRRVAQTKSQFATIVKWLVIVALLIFETVVNGLYLAKGSDEGVIGGIAIAMGFAITNVLGTVVIAWTMIPNIVHRSFFRKLWGFLGVLLWLALAIGINLAMAHYREASTGDEVQISALVMDRLKTATFNFQEIDSWMLFGAGFMFSVIAMLDVLSIRDIYPGYGGVYQRYVDAEENYAFQKEDLIGELKLIRDDHNDKVEMIIRDLSIRRRESASIIENRARIIRLFNEQQDRLEEVARTLIATYREANRQARTKPEPKYFSSQFKLERRKAVISSANEWTDQELADRIKHAEAELAEQMKQIGNEFEAAVSAYRQLDDLFPEANNGKA